MNTSLDQQTAPSERLEELGFRRNGRSRFQRRDLTVTPGRDFWTISAPATGEASSVQGQLGKRGLWKLVDGRSGERIWEFHLPSTLFETTESADDNFDDCERDGDVLATCLAWAEATFADEIHSAWQPPSKTQLETWIAKERLTVQAGPIVRQAIVVCDLRRLAVRFPLVYQSSGQLSPARRKWLHAALAEAQNRWMMARVGYRDANSPESLIADHAMPAICAELDLTGAPEAALECLLKTGVDGLRWVVSWLLWPVGFLSDPSVTSSAWEIPPERAFGAEVEVGAYGPVR